MVVLCLLWADSLHIHSSIPGLSPWYRVTQKAAEFSFPWEIENPNMNKCGCMKIKLKKFIFTYLYPHSISLPIISLAHKKKNDSVSVSHWVLPESALWKLNYFFLLEWKNKTLPQMRPGLGLSKFGSDTLTKKNRFKLGQHVVCLFRRGNSRLRTIKKEGYLRYVHIFLKSTMSFSLASSGMGFRPRWGLVTWFEVCCSTLRWIVSLWNATNSP